MSKFTERADEDQEQQRTARLQRKLVDEPNWQLTQWELDKPFNEIFKPTEEK